MGDFRPISILDALLKIISKILAKRILDVLGDTIDDHRIGFLKVKSTLESITAAQDVIQFTKWNKALGFMLKLDFEKAYEMTEWDCTLEVLRS